jgi:hypothetical protein
MKHRQSKRKVLNSSLGSTFKRLARNLRITIMYDHYKGIVDAANVKLSSETARLGLNPRAVTENASFDYGPEGSATYPSALMFCLIPGIERWSSPFEEQNIQHIASWLDLPLDQLSLAEHDKMANDAGVQLAKLLTFPLPRLKRAIQANPPFRVLFAEVPPDSPYASLTSNDETKPVKFDGCPDLVRMCTMFLCIGGTK